MRHILAALAALLISASALADTRIAVLDFELNDLTLEPRTPTELERTARVAPLLREALAARKGYALVAVDPAAQEKADVSVGYLFDHPDAAAELGRRFNADWIAVGRLHKPSPLFSYLKVKLVEAKTGEIKGDYVVEIKGQFEQTASRGTAILAEQIDDTLRGR